MRNLVKVFKALSDVNRLRILKMLEIQPLCVCEITAVLKLAPSTVSKHLSLLRDANLIHDEKEGKWVNYYLNKNGLDLYSAELLILIKKWLINDELIQNDSLMVSKVDRNQLCRG